MTFCIAVFRSRTQVMEFIEYMQSRGIDSSAINTPAEAHVGCGISAKFPKIYLNYAKEVVRRLSLVSLTGFYELKINGGRTSVRRI